MLVRFLARSRTKDSRLWKRKSLNTSILRVNVRRYDDKGVVVRDDPAVVVGECVEDSRAVLAKLDTVVYLCLNILSFSRHAAHTMLILSDDDNGKYLKNRSLRRHSFYIGPCEKPRIFDNFRKSRFDYA